MNAVDSRDLRDENDQDLQELRQHLTGTLLLPTDPLYDEARRVWNGMIDLHPRAVVRAGSVHDIDAVLAAARRIGLPLAVRGGGHSVAGHGTVDDGLVLDLGGLRGVVVDETNQLVRVEAGATLADVDRATEPHSLAVPLGVISQTGVAGLTLGGGVGWLTRSHGLSLDNLDSADVVTATGEHLHASPDENPELFWGLRGGGGNFGVVSSFTFRAHRLPRPLLVGNLIYRQQNWRAALGAFARWTEDLPDEMNAIVSILRLPPEFEVGDDPVLVVGFSWVSPDHDAGTALIERLRTDAPPDLEEVGPMAWTEWQSSMDTLFPKGSRGYWKNAAFSRLDDEVIDALLGFASEVTWYGTGIDIHHMEGAFGRVPESATAFPNRSSRYWLNVYGFWHDPAEDARLTAFARRAHADMEPFADTGQYVNFLGAEHGPVTPEAARLAYGPDSYQRLAELKKRYDPDNIFRLNHNIVPATA
jgi:FAD/FMN-containing dehydrogenase